MERRMFECISCGNLTLFLVSEPPRCAKCGSMTGIVDNDSESPRLTPSPGQASPELNDPSRRRDH